ncbi:MAG: AraC family transcriptional regulator ligand-binding domain-containing protein [Myxococcota bacterium]|nr:AraC family transcriptional regulator ligand-binding domain-containing protein [Myxococcota bacterium]
MSVQTSTALVALVRNAGVSTQELARAAGFAREIVESPTMVSYAEGVRIWEAAERLTGDPNVGLTAGARCRPDQIPVLGTLFGHCADLTDALRRLARLVPMVIRGVPVGFDGDTGTFSYTSPSTTPHGVDAMFAAVVQLARHCAEAPIAPCEVQLQSAPPRHPEVYERFFEVRPRWGAKRSSLRFTRATLAIPFRGAAPALAALLEERAPALIEPAGAERRDLRAAIIAAIRASLQDGLDPTLSRVALDLGTSPRTLQRRLADRGLRFTALRDATRRALAEEAVLTGSEPTLQIALRLGFASRSSFERAFRRWTGETPARARERSLGQGSGSSPSE